MELYFIFFVFITLRIGETHDTFNTATIFSKAKLKETDTRRGFPEPKSFQKDHGKVPGGRPLLMKAAASAEASFAKMPDTVLSFLPHAYITFVEMKKRTELDSNKVISLRSFLQTYTDEDSYIDQQIPDVLKTQITLPKPIQCSVITDELLTKTRLQLRRGLWNDPFTRIPMDSQIICMLDGKANVILINSEKLKMIELDEEGKSEMNFEIKPELLKDVSEFQETKLQSGDCIFVPSNWIYHTSTENRAMITSIFWKAIKNQNQNSCGQDDNFDQSISLDKLGFQNETSENIFNLLTLNDVANFIEKFVLPANVTQENFIDRFKKDEKLKNVQKWDVECQSTAEELFAEFDVNDDKILSSIDFENLSKEETIYRGGVLEDRMADFREIIEDQEHDFKKKDKSVLGMVSNMKVDYEKEIQKVLEDGFNEILREINVGGAVSFSEDGTPQVKLDKKDLEDSSESLLKEEHETIEDILAEDEPTTNSEKSTKSSETKDEL